MFFSQSVIKIRSVTYRLLGVSVFPDLTVNSRLLISALLVEDRVIALTP